MNRALRKLGFSPNDRVAVVHADDIGMCHGTLPAIEELFSLGIVTSASAMVPCPWFNEFAVWRRNNTQVDVGVHLTITSEFAAYRWRPVADLSPRNDLLDDQGYFHDSVASVVQYAGRRAVRTEFDAQLQTAIRAALSPTHLDSHMYAALSDEFLEDYAELGFAHSMPIFLPRTFQSPLVSSPRRSLTIRSLETRGMPVFDHFEVSTRSLDEHAHFDYVKSLFANLKPGLSCILMHPAKGVEELRRITSDWRGRVNDYLTFRKTSLKSVIRQQGVHLVSYTDLRRAGDWKIGPSGITVGRDLAHRSRRR